MDLRTLDVRTAEGHTLKVGVCADGCTGPAVLIVPGLYSHMGWYRPLGEALAARGSAAYLLDRRGAGISEGLPGHMDSWRHLVDDIRRVAAKIKELHPSARLCALGISLGAAMTLATSLVQADCFQRQAALSPGLAPGLQLPLMRRIGLAYSGFARPRVLYELPFTVEQLSDQEELRQALWSDPLRTRAVTSRFLLEVFRMQRSVRRNIVRLRLPMLALLAEKDAMVDNQVVLETLNRVEGTPVRVEIFEGAHHVLPASVPLEELVGRIDHWFTAPDDALDRRVVIQRVPQAGVAVGGEGDPVKKDGESRTAMEPDPHSVRAGAVRERPKEKARSLHPPRRSNECERFSTLRRLASDPKKRFVVCMGGGGVPALCGNTVLAEVIERLDLREHVAEVWGTSAGAIAGGSWASGTSAARMMEVLHSFRSLRMTDFDWLNLVKGVLFGAFGVTLPDAILRGRRAHQAMLAGLSAETFEQCEIPFRCIACSDDPSGRRTVFREGPLAPAISASMSLPGIFLPRGADGRRCHGFLDGGLVEKTPLYSPIADHTRLGDDRELLILGTYFGVQTNQKAIAHGFVDRFLVTIDTLADQLWEHQEQAARREPGVTVLLVNARIGRGSAHLDFSDIDRDCEQARAAFEDQLQNATIALTAGSSCTPNRCPL